MNQGTIQKGFIAAGLMNIGGVLILSRAFTNEVINQADPIILSNFGLLMIVIWGFAYLAVAKHYKEVRWLPGVFAIEKLIYTFVWMLWIKDNGESLGSMYSYYIFAGVFFMIYGINDFIFMLFFAYVFLKLRNCQKLLIF